MFDGAMVSDAVDVVVQSNDANVQAPVVDEQESAEKDISRDEIVVFVSSVSNYQRIVDAIGSDVDVFILSDN